MRIPRSEIERLKGGRSDRLLVLYGRVRGQGRHRGARTGRVCRSPTLAVGCGQAVVTLMVLESGEDTSPAHEFTADLLSLIASFSGGSLACGLEN
jgi:hypothetical protein